jgi:cytosolic carboxypeptidase protein 2/3
MEGLAQRLKELTLSEVMWILVPMVNIDGVLMGNNRTGLMGYDFNRHWYIDREANRHYLFPELIGIIKYFQGRQADFAKKVKVFLDLHGHSSEPNVFAYGPAHHRASEYYDLSRLLPFLVSRRNPDFSHKQCSYDIPPNKRHCARAVFFERFGFHFSYTL